MKALIGIRNGLIISLVLWALIFLAVKCFAIELVEKVDDFSAKITISNVNDKDGVKTTVSQERVFTLDELLTAKTASETALKSWQDEVRDEAIKVQKNITIQTTQIALWERLIKQTIDLGIVVKPIEQPMEEVIK